MVSRLRELLDWTRKLEVKYGWLSFNLFIWFNSLLKIQEYSTYTTSTIIIAGVNRAVPRGKPTTACRQNFLSMAREQLSSRPESVSSINTAVNMGYAQRIFSTDFSIVSFSVGLRDDCGRANSHSLHKQEPRQQSRGQDVWPEEPPHVRSTVM